MTTQVMIKVNVSGSWANLVWCDAGNFEAVKDACEGLAQAAGHAIRFRAIDVAGGDLAHYGPPEKGAAPCWHKPPFHNGSRGSMRRKAPLNTLDMWACAYGDLCAAVEGK